MNESEGFVWQLKQMLPYKSMIIITSSHKKSQELSDGGEEDKYKKK